MPSSGYIKRILNKTQKKKTMDKRKSIIKLKVNTIKY